MSAIAGLRGTGNFATDERPKNFRELILFRNPNGTAPIFALMARVAKATTDDPEFSWWDEPNDLFRVQVNGALTSVATTVVVDSLDPSVTSPGLAYGTATHLTTGDLLMVEPATDVVGFTPEVVRVVSVTNDTTFVVTRGAAGTTAAAIADNAYLLRIGPAFEEGTSEANSASRNPIKYSNFTQIIKTSYEVTGTAAKTRLRTGDVLANERKRGMFKHAQSLELSLLFGQKSELPGAGGNPVRTMGGLRTFIGAATTTILGAGWTLNDFLDAASPVFDFDTPAGDERIVFAGNGALNALNKKIAAASGQSAINVNVAEKASAFGVNFMEYVLPQGRLFIKTHPLMNRHSLYTNSMFVLDFGSLKYRPMVGRDTKFVDNIQTKGEDLVRGQWITEAGLEVDFGGLTNGYIGGFGN